MSRKSGAPQACAAVPRRRAPARARPGSLSLCRRVCARAVCCGARCSARKQFGRLLCEALPDCERPDLSAPAGEINVSAFSVEEVGDWLKAEGFGDVRAKFVANAVDGPALLDLNEVRDGARRAACPP